SWGSRPAPGREERMLGFVRTRGASLVLAILTVGLLLGSHLGCGNNPASPSGQGSAGAQPTNEAPATPAAAGGTLDPVLHQSFADATRQEPPPDQRPPDRTMTGKSVGKLYTEVTRIWDSILFTSAGGKRLHYRAVVETALGDFEIDLRPDAAPNHVRSFIALA